MSAQQLSALRSIASKIAERSFVPYSGKKEAALLLLSDGSWIPGVRVESATYSLVIQPLLNAVTTAVSLNRTDIVAAVMSRPFHPGERNYASLAPFLRRLTPSVSDTLIHGNNDLPEVAEEISPFEYDDSKIDGQAGLALVREIANRAYVPESDFPVGCLFEVQPGTYVPGVNVEHPEWDHILCAERNALGTCISYGLAQDISSITVTCLKDPKGSPCGACRQLMVELAPTATLWMDRGDGPPAQSDPITLLPGSFTGDRLTSKT